MAGSTILLIKISHSPEWYFEMYMNRNGYLYIYTGWKFLTIVLTNDENMRCTTALSLLLLHTCFYPRRLTALPAAPMVLFTLIPFLFPPLTTPPGCHSSLLFTLIPFPRNFASFS